MRSSLAGGRLLLLWRKNASIAAIFFDTTSKALRGLSPGLLMFTICAFMRQMALVMMSRASSSSGDNLTLLARRSS